MKNLFLLASSLTDPICKAREKYWLGKATGTNLFLQAAMYFIVGIILAPFGILVRYFAKRFQKNPYLFTRGEGQEISLDKRLSLLSWNVCCISAGYAITDGGLIPWEGRIKKIAQRIQQENADVVCLMEVFDTKATQYLLKTLKGSYAYLYHSIGIKSVGISSGFFIASKVVINNFEFIRFPKDHLVGRTKNMAKGITVFDIGENDNNVQIFLSHFQHSEECEFPTREEITAREHQMNIILDKIKTADSLRVTVTGDLNLDEEELASSSWANMFDRGVFPEGKTWKGDEFCANLVGKKPSSARTYDYTMVLNNNSLNIISSYIETGYDPKHFSKEALSDHKGIVSVISLK